jgi:serine O-acetyltransferase
MFSKLREDIKSIIERDPAARNGWEVFTCYPGFQAIMMHRWAHACWTGQLKWTGRFISYLARIVTGIEIHPGATIGRRVFIDHGFGVVIGETAVVGDDCTIYQGVTLGGTTLTSGSKRHPTLERGVIIGAGAKVLGAFTVGEYAKIGSNAVVVKPVPSGATAIGIPARIVESHEAQGRFAAYAVARDVNDPVAQALHELIDHSAENDRRIEHILAELQRLGVKLGEEPASSFDANHLNRIVD